MRTLVDPNDDTFDCVFLGTEDGTDYFGWVKDFPPYGMEGASTLSWDTAKFQKCVILGSIVGCGVSAAICVFTLVLWPICAGDGCAGSIAASLIVCAVDQLLG